MNSVTTWFRGHRVIASVVTVSLIVGVPLTFAAINQGYPVTDVQLSGRDVWVTKTSGALAGRLNTQVGQLDSSVSTVTKDFDVLQDGETILLDDTSAHVLRQVDPNLIQTSNATETALPIGAQAKLDGGVLAIESPQGRLWRVPVPDGTTVNFNYQSAASVPIPTLSNTAQFNVERDGTVDIATTTGTLYQLNASTGAVTSEAIPNGLSDFQLSSVGNVPVILDRADHKLIEGNGTSFTVPGALSLQQPGDAASYALLEGSDDLIRVDLGSGTTTSVHVKGASGSSDLPQPVHMGNCDNGVWGATAVAVYSCVGSRAIVNQLGYTSAKSGFKSFAGGIFTFRVNQLSVALNDISNGYSWLTGSGTTISNWATVPPQQQSPQTGKTNGKNVTYVQSSPKFSAQNHPPVAVDYSFGVRPGETTALPVLKDDTDPDGDVLTVASMGKTPSSFGTIQPGVGGQSPQFTPADGVTSGSYTVPYSINDGRGGTASASVRVTVWPLNIDHAPQENRTASVLVEQGQTVTYNVLDDWTDPDGDQMQVVAASDSDGDDVRFTPDGYITFQSTSSIGVKTVNYTVQDSASQHMTTKGTLIVDVKADGSTTPLAESDYGSGIVGTAITVSPLLNDRAPSGQPLHLQSIKALVGSGPAPSINATKGTVQFNENQAGSYDFEYTETAGTSTKAADAFIRLDVTDPPTGHAAPVAVSDVVYLTYPGTVTVPVLDNDISPEGLVLGVQSISVPTVSGFSAQVLSNTTVKITSTGTSPGDAPIIIPYTISDGTASSSATITVVPVSQLVNHQKPITTDDLVTVRAGEVATASVLDNDVDPDGATMSVSPTLVQGPSAGLAFVTGNDVRFQAPSTPGQYSVVYTVTDTGAQTSTGRVLFTVTPASSKNNHAPQPVPVVARVFSGGTVRVDIPLAGIDPDGDTALLESIPQNPRRGTITDVTSQYFDYQAGADSTGTDTFTYEVTDQFGATAIAPVTIGVIPRPGLEAPVAVDDNAALKPNTSATVSVLANDSDPNGYSIAIVPNSVRNVGTKSINASSTDGQTVVLHAGSQVGSFNVQYAITDGHSKQHSTAIIHVTVSKTALDLPPVAVDHVLQLKDVASGKPVKVDARSGASDPSGIISALGVSLPGKLAASARVAGGNIYVTPGKTPETVAYRLTDPRTKLDSTAFILIPAIPPVGWNLAPYLNKKLGSQIVTLDTSKTFALSTIVTVPAEGGLPAKLIDKGRLSAAHGKVISTAPGEFTYTPNHAYTGPDSITFEVADSAHPTHTAILTLPVTVEDSNGLDLTSTFTTVHVNVAKNSNQIIDLLNSTSNPSHVSYSLTSGSTSDVSGSVSGSQFTVSVAVGARLGAQTVFKIQLTKIGSPNPPTTGEIIVTVVQSTAPLPEANTDTAHVSRGQSVQIEPMANDVNPFPGKPMTLQPGTKIVTAGTGATVQTDTSADTVTVTAGASFIGTVTLQYTIQDAAGRDVTGQILVTVWDVPDAPAAPTISGFGDGSATIVFNTPDSDNGSPVTGYTVRSSPATTAPTCSAGANCTFTDLQNGTAYVFYVSATNQVGTSAESPASASVTPYRAPSAPNGATLSSSGNAPATLYMSWGGSSDTGGGNVTYTWTLSSGSGTVASSSTGGTSASYGVGAGTYTFSVYASNPGGASSTVTSNQVVVSAPPPTLSISKGAKDTTDCQSTDPNCEYVDVSGAHFAPNTQVTVSYNTNHGGYGQFITGTYTTDSSGSFSGSSVYFSYTGYEVWANVGTVQSNTITW